MICRASSSRFPPEADSPTTRNLSRLPAITSSVWVPIDPVEPSRQMVRTGQVYVAAASRPGG